MSITVTCGKGHTFAALPSHPHANGDPICIFCTLGLLHESRENTAQAVAHSDAGWGRAAERLQELCLLRSAARKMLNVVANPMCLRHELSEALKNFHIVLGTVTAEEESNVR